MCWHALPRGWCDGGDQRDVLREWRCLIGLLLGGLVYVGLLWGLRAFNAQERAVLRPLLQRV